MIFCFCPIGIGSRRKGMDIFGDGYGNRPKIPDIGEFWVFFYRA